MRVLLIGGIYGMSESFRTTNLQETTETLLERGLIELGHEVVTNRHKRWNSLRDIDIVHVHHLASSCPQFALRRSIPLVFTRHATKELPRAHSLVLRLTQNRAQAVVALSDVERAHLTSDVPEDRLHRIYNGVDSSEFYPPPRVRTAPPDGEHWRILYVGQLIELKRVHLALRLIADLRNRGISARLTLVTQRDTLRRELADYARELGVEACLSWLGPRTKPQVAHLMRESHLLVVPSRTEALSTVVTEACLTGLPVAAFKVGGMPEQLPSTMELLEAHETERFSSSVASILRTYDSYTRLFLNHSQEATARFSVQTMVDDHVRLYERILSA